VSCLVVAMLALAVGCDPVTSTDGGVAPSDPDANAQDARVDEAAPDAGGPSTEPDAGEPNGRPDASQPAPDAHVPGPDGGVVIEDAGVVVDGGPLSLPDLVVDLPPQDMALGFRSVEISEDDCELFEGCVGGTGTRSLLELSFVLRNQGQGALELGRPFENPLYYPSFCQDSYVIDGFFAAELQDGDGDVVASGRLSTSCIADLDGGDYTCRAQGLSPDEGSAQPIGRCDFLDITGLAAGSYTLVVTANADHAVWESDFDNNSSTLSFDYVPCDGTVCGGECCPTGIDCYQGTCMLPDLRINEESASQSVWITHQTFGENSCEIEEMCVNGDGRRRLLQFEGRIENWGPGDLNPGPEANNPLYEYSECHGHYHFLDFTDYRLLNQDGSVAAFGHKQSFCLVDIAQVEGATVVAPPGTRPPPGETGCSYLSAGWADIYGVGTPCQWVDITDVAPGDYVLQLTVNPENAVHEADTENNIVQVQVHIPEDVPCEPQPEICGDNIDQDCDDQPDSWDPDCYGCAPWDPWCEDVEHVSGNETCDDAYAMVEQTTYEATLADDDAEIDPSCGGAGGDLFFSFTLEREQAVFLGTMGSHIDTVLALYAGGCGGEQLRCEDDACHSSASQLVDILPAGDYMVAVKAKTAGDQGRVRLKLQHADAHGAMVLDAPGVYVGDTTASDDSAQSCSYSYPEPDHDAGVDVPTEEECVHTAEAAAGGIASHACLHCACGVDPASVAACDGTCWSLIQCVRDNCGGDGADLNCVVSQCQAYLSAATAAQAAGNALGECPEACPSSGGGTAGAGAVGGAGGGIAGASGTSAGGAGGIGGSHDGGVSWPPVLSPARDDIYVLASCQQGVTVSTCGTSMFDSVIEIRSGSLDDGTMYSCSEDYNLCQADERGAATNVYGTPGLTFVIIDGASEAEAGAYQMSVIY